MLRNRFLCLCCLLLTIHTYGQQQQPLQTVLQAAIQRSYNASIKAWAYDTARKVQNGAQFSAVVVSSDGYILTVAHAIQPNRTYKLSFPDGKEAIAVGLGRIDLATMRTMPDVAVMKIIGNGPWPFAEMGNAAALQKGDPCFSIGYPESLAQALPDVRFGFIVVPQTSAGFIHSSCAMEVGDSGGPLFDLQGHVIGLNSRCDTSEDINYHVPVDLYRKYYTALKKPENYTDYPTADEAVAQTGTTATSYVPAATKASLSSSASVQVQSNIAGKQQFIAGTAIEQKGKGTCIISKSSCVGDTAIVILAGQRPIKATILARSKEHDLVLLYIDQKIKGAITMADASYGDNAPAAGTFVYAALAEGKQERGIAGSQVFSLPAKFSSGYFGANATWTDGAAAISRIQPNSPVIAAGLQEKDKVLQIGNKPVGKPEDYGNLLQQYFPYDTVKLQIKRGDSIFSKQVVLPVKPERKSTHPADWFAGGKSERRDGFPKVWLFDARIKAAECGTPVYDATGKYCGIAIARFSRTAALIIPAGTINQWIKQPIK